MCVCVCVCVCVWVCGCVRGYLSARRGCGHPEWQGMSVDSQSRRWNGTGDGCCHVASVLVG